MTPFASTRRVLSAVGTTDAVFEPDQLNVSMNGVQICRNGSIGDDRNLVDLEPREVFVEIGLELKRKSPLQPTFTIELANGYNGYLPTPEQHRLGGYETWRARSSYLETEASTKIARTILDLFEQIK